MPPPLLAPRSKRLFLFGLLAIGLLFLSTLIFNPFSQPVVVELIESRLSSDGSVTCPACLLNLLRLILFYPITTGWVSLFLLSAVVGGDIRQLRAQVAEMSLSEKFGYGVSAALILLHFLVTGLSLGKPQWFHEDGWLERISALVLFITAAVLVLAARSSRGARRRGLLLASAFFLFVCLEEISWGQHLFHWATPDFLQEINLQGETNLHNLIDNGLFWKINNIVLLTIGLVIIFRIACARSWLIIPGWLGFGRCCRPVGRSGLGITSSYLGTFQGTRSCMRRSLPYGVWFTGFSFFHSRMSTPIRRELGMILDRSVT